MTKNKTKKWCAVLSAILVLMAFGITSCDPTTGSSDVYTGKISNLNYTTNEKTVTFTWTNPADKNFCGVRILKGDVLYETLEKNKSQITVSGLEYETDYTFTFKAIALNSSGVEIESSNVVTKTISVTNYAPKYPYLGRGYDVARGEFFCASKDLKGQILKFDASFKPMINTSVNSSDVTYTAGRTFKSYHDQFGEAVGVTGGYAGFSASIDVDFSTESSFSEEKSFASANGMNKKVCEYIDLTQTSIENLRKHITDEFKSAINDDNVSPKEIFNTYGTHVLLDTYIGGRFVVNYIYDNTEYEDSSSIKAAVQANYEGAFKVGGSSTTTYGEGSKMTTSNTSISGYSRGGKGISFGSLADAMEVWKSWNESLEDEATWSFIYSAETVKNEDTKTGVWLFADKQSRREQIKKAYKELLDANITKIDNMQVKKYIRDVHILDSDCLFNTGDSLEKMRTAVEAVIKTSNFSIIGENAAGKKASESVLSSVKKFDLMSGAGHNTVYLAVEYTTDKNDALRGVLGNSSTNFDNTKNINYRHKGKYDTSKWALIKPLKSKDPDYCGGDNSRVIFASKQQSREGKTGDQAYPIREVVIYNGTQKVSSASKLVTQGCLVMNPYDIGDNEDIAKDTGGDFIYIQLYYDPEDMN